MSDPSFCCSFLKPVAHLSGLIHISKHSVPSGGDGQAVLAARQLTVGLRRPQAWKSTLANGEILKPGRRAIPEKASKRKRKGGDAVDSSGLPGGLERMQQS